MNPLPQVRWFRGRCLAVVLAVATLVPGAAWADTHSKLPKGYTSDLPQLPSTNPDAQNVNDESTDDAEDASDEYADTDASALTEWREPLAPYGTWVVDANYGTVWVPNAVVVGADFAPYVSAGHWELDDDDQWIWVSDYGWGWIPFHYGRWVWISGRDWAWIPGRAYAPAWVVWRVGDGGYIGWAPMPPAWYWDGGVAVTLWAVPPAAYVFCPTVYVFETHVHHHIIHEHGAVKSAAGATRPYKPASPHKPANPQGAGHKGADPGASGGSPDGKASGGGAKSVGGASAPGHRVASPSMTEAHVPKSVKPKHSRGDERALSYSHPSTTPRRSPTARRSPEALTGPIRRGRSSDDTARRHAPGVDPPTNRAGREPFSQRGREPFALPEVQPSQPSRGRRDAAPRPPVDAPAPRSAPPARAPKHTSRDSSPSTHDSAPSAPAARAPAPPAARAPAPPARAPSAAPAPRPVPPPARPAPRRR